jgi:BolA family transcriptional regulator, general stress-responsive regulator
MTTGVTADDVQQALQSGLAGIIALEVHDDSAAHAGHAGARDGSHFRVRITATAFAGLGRVARHRLVYDSLALLMPQGIHALAIDARAPGEV